MERSLGIHVSISGTIDQAVDRATDVGCSGTFQIFTCSPRRWKATPLRQADADLFKKKTVAHNFRVFTHMPYLPNLSSPDKSFYEQSIQVLIREIERCQILGIGFLVLHFGSHLGTSLEEGHKRFIAACKKALGSSESSTVVLLLENSAGTKNSLGSDFSHIKRVLEGIGHTKRMGVCFDTCHAFASGYDLRDKQSVVQTMAEFDRVVGFERLCLIHLNDSLGELGSGRDRHQQIGKGEIRNEGFRAFLDFQPIRHVPLVLETPIEKDGDDKKNIQAVKNLISS